MKDNKHKFIWGIVIALLLAIAVSVSVYVDNVKQMAPTESEDVIALVPEDKEETEEPEEAETAEKPQDSKETDQTSAEAEETVKIETPKSSLKNGASSAGGVRMEKRQVGTLNAEMTVEDERQVWLTETSIDIFQKAYKGAAAVSGKDKYTVKNGSNDGMNVIAPGTGNEYTFWVKNTGQVGLDYRVWFEENNTKGYIIPLEVRVKCGGSYILGSERKWEPIESLDKLEHEGHLGVKNYAQYTLEWRWPFERGQDDYDTYLGDEAVKKLIEQEIVIHTYGEGYDRPIYEMFAVSGIKTGDSANMFLWLLILIIALAVLYCVRKISAKGKNEEEEIREESGEKHS